MSDCAAQLQGERLDQAPLEVERTVEAARKPHPLVDRGPGGDLEPELFTEVVEKGEPAPVYGLVVQD
jgi:hypothetical protein